MKRFLSLLAIGALVCMMFAQTAVVALAAGEPAAPVISEDGIVFYAENTRVAITKGGTTTYYEVSNYVDLLGQVTLGNGALSVPQVDNKGPFTFQYTAGWWSGFQSVAPVGTVDMSQVDTLIYDFEPYREGDTSSAAQITVGGTQIGPALAGTGGADYIPNGHYIGQHAVGSWNFESGFSFATSKNWVHFETMALVQLGAEVTPGGAADPNGIAPSLMNTRITITRNGIEEEPFVVEEYCNLFGTAAKVNDGAGTFTTEQTEGAGKFAFGVDSGVSDQVTIATVDGPADMVGAGDRHLLIDFNVDILEGAVEANKGLDLRVGNVWDTAASLTEDLAAASGIAANTTSLGAGRYILDFDLTGEAYDFTNGLIFSVVEAEVTFNSVALVSLPAPLPPPEPRTEALGDIGVTFPDFTILGAGVRTGRADGQYDLRFGVQVSDNAFGATSLDETSLDGVIYDTVKIPAGKTGTPENLRVKFGTVAIPVNELGVGELVSLETADVLNIPTDFWQPEIQDGSGNPIPGDVYTSVITGVPDGSTELMARAYILFTMGGVDYVLYSEPMTRSVNSTNEAYWKEKELPPVLDADGDYETYLVVGGVRYDYSESNLLGTNIAMNHAYNTLTPEQNTMLKRANVKLYLDVTITTEASGTYFAFLTPGEGMAQEFLGGTMVPGNYKFIYDVDLGGNDTMWYETGCSVTSNIVNTAKLIVTG